MSITFAQLDAVSIGDAIYLTTHPLTVREVIRMDGFIPVIKCAGKHGGWIQSFPIVASSCDRIRRIVPACKRRKPHTRKEYAFQHTDGGRAVESFDTETNDCTVRALALATGSTYADAHAHMAMHGRKHRKGSHVCLPYSASRLGGFTCARIPTHAMPVDVRRRTFGQWLESGELPARCVVVVPKHAIAVVDGKVCDAFKVGSRRTVLSLWEFRPMADGADALESVAASNPPMQSAVDSADASYQSFRMERPDLLIVRVCQYLSRQMPNPRLVIERMQAADISARISASAPSAPSQRIPAIAYDPATARKFHMPGTHRLTHYEFACGYIQQSETPGCSIESGISVTLWKDASVWQVRAHDFANGRIFWDSFDTLTLANRRYYRALRELGITRP